jgi:primosomal protein N' (replication factor Y)
VTGSGKTEVYIKLVERALELNLQTIVLVPEIILTPQTVQRFEEVFGENIALMHSQLSRSEKYNCYWDFYNGTKKILIGPRSALLVPSRNLGLIIVDEEQEDAFKQEQNPRYHAVELAEKMASLTSSLLVLGSATPRIETYYKAKSGEFELYEIASRFERDEMPKSTIIDLKMELRGGNTSPISLKLQEQLKTVLSNKKQALLFLNRRGMSTFVSCRDCGEVINCPNCLIPLVYHVNSRESKLNCHHCDHKALVPQSCPKCGSLRIKFFGAGIERIEQEIRKMFPEAKVRLIDSASAKNKGEYEKFYNELKSGAIDIAIGTQVLAKGLDIANIDLVGVISADTGLHMPHYRATEKVFQIISQVSGRSGRKHNAGETIIQSYWPETSAIINASEHDFVSFYNDEIENRRGFQYPPFGKIVRVIAENIDEKVAQQEMYKLAEKLRENKFVFLGPSPCFYQKLHNKFRYHIIIKIDKIPDQKLSEIYHQHDNLIWDADAINLL